MSGYIAIQRGLLEHPLFKPEPFTEREAWIWLIEEAAWKPCRVRIGAEIVSLDRGQLAHSVRYMAKAWRWEQTKVWRFLKKLRTNGMIENAQENFAKNTTASATATQHQTQRISICNYDKYQPGGNSEESKTATPNATVPQQDRNKEETIKQLNKEDDDEDGAPLVAKQADRVADEVAKICGHDLKFIPPAWHGAAYRVQSWLAQGWREEIILASCREQIAKKRDGPPDRIQYFEKGIAAAIARANAPLPEVQFVEGQTVEVKRGKPETLTDVARRLSAEVIGFGPKPSLTGRQTDGDAVRLLPQGGRE